MNWPRCPTNTCTLSGPRQRRLPLRQRPPGPPHGRPITLPAIPSDDVADQRRINSQIATAANTTAVHAAIHRASSSCSSCLIESKIRWTLAHRECKGRASSRFGFREHPVNPLVRPERTVKSDRSITRSPGEHCLGGVLVPMATAPADRTIPTSRPTGWLPWVSSRSRRMLLHQLVSSSAPTRLALFEGEFRQGGRGHRIASE